MIDDLTPHLDPELRDMFSAGPTLDLATTPIAEVRATAQAAIAMMMSAVPLPDTVRIEDHEVPATGDQPAVPVRVFRPAAKPSGAILMWIHGGGFVMGHRNDVQLSAAAWVEATGCTIVSPGYRLAPEHPGPASSEDCYAALCWAADPAGHLGFTPTRVAIGGTSAGGCLAAAVTLMARDRGGPSLCHQFLQIPTVDNRHETPSSHTIHDKRTWCRETSLVAWEMYAGPNPTRSDLSPYIAPARAEELSGLPPCYLEIADLDLLRDEAVDYGSRLTQAGVPTEVHVYPGTFHGATIMTPTAVCQRAVADMLAAITRALT